MTYSRAGRTTIGPGCLSAVFGMGTGVSTRVWSPAVSVQRRERRCVYLLTSRVGYVVASIRTLSPTSQPLHITEVGRVGGAAKRSAVSTGPLSASLHLHIRPIDQVVCLEPSSCEGNPDLGGSFTLICLQRLSDPHVATRNCR